MQAIIYSDAFQVMLFSCWFRETPQQESHYNCVHKCMLMTPTPIVIMQCILLLEQPSCCAHCYSTYIYKLPAKV